MSKTDSEKIAVMQAAVEGKEIQHRYIGPDATGVCKINSVWMDSTPPHAAPQWYWHLYDYRVKPQEPAIVRLHVSKDGTPWIRDPQPTGNLVEFIELTPEVRSKLGL